MKWFSTMLAAALGIAALMSTSSAEAQEAEAPQIVEARAAYNHGVADHEVGRYEEALAHFQHAYEVSNLGPILFNAATTLDRLFRFVDAVASYRAYLDRGDVPNAEYVRARIHRLERRLLIPNQVSREPEALAALAPLPPSLREPSPSQLLPTMMMIGGGVVALASMGPGLAALGIRGDLRDRCVNARCTEADRADAEKMDRLAITSDILLVAGVGVAVGGLVWFLLRRRTDAAEAPVALSCTTDGCSAQTTIAF